LIKLDDTKEIKVEPLKLAPIIADMMEDAENPNQIISVN